MDAFARLSSDPRKAALVMDFDGVLSPIVADPAASAIHPGAHQALTYLSQHLGLVGLLSGRPIAFLQEKVQIPGISYYGSYGVETLTGDTVTLHPATASWMNAVREARDQLFTEFGGLDGFVIEEKTISVAIHWRNVPERDEAEKQVEAVVRQIEQSTGLHREPGKLVQELRPPVDVDKGTALRQIMDETGLQIIAYAGDDKGDLPAFRVAVETGNDALAVDHGRETDPRLLELATETFQGVAAFAAWLTKLADQVRPPR